MGDAILKCNGCTQCCRGPGRVLFLNPRQPLKHLDVNIITRYYPDSSKEYKLFVLKQKTMVIVSISRIKDVLFGISGPKSVAHMTAGVTWQALLNGLDSLILL